MSTDKSELEQLVEVSELESTAAGERLASLIPSLNAPVSGLYTWSQSIFPFPPTPLPVEPIPIPGPNPGPFLQFSESTIESQAQAEAAPPTLLLSREELRLDVDRWYPQRVASGTVIRGFGSRVHWIARLVQTGANTWTGSIWYKEGDVASLPYTTVKIQVVRSFFPASRIATVTFSGGGVLNRVRTLRFASQYFHPTNFEFDCAQGESATLSINTGGHPNRPAGLPIENLTIQRVFERAGFSVSTSPGGPVPISGAGVDARWSDQEMHDAMQTFWSRFANAPQWALWVFFASLHEMGTSLGGVMFDDIGPNHRQGTSIFNDSFVATPPPGDPNPAAWVRRMIFWTACHEMGHSFNLAHSWQKSLGTPWIPLANEPEARSFMNYPYGVTGGQAGFFSTFQFRFSDGELLFMRHAPERFAQMGNADWFDHHGFQSAAVLPEPTFKLELRANREQPKFEFLEPVTLELKLTNNSSQLQLVDEKLLSASDSLLVIVKKENQPARQYLPYAHYCFLPRKIALKPEESLYESLFVSTGVNGWTIAEPGNYLVQVALHINGEDIISNPLPARVAPPRGYEEEVIAQDFFTEEVGRAITFDGTRYFEQANNTLREVVAKLPDRRVSIHASLALGEVIASDYKQLVVDPGAEGKGFKFEVRPPEVAEARNLLSKALIEKPDTAAETLGHVDYNAYVNRASEDLSQHGAPDTAAVLQETLLNTLSNRKVRGRKVLDSVLQDIRERRDQYAAGGGALAASQAKAGTTKTK